MRNPESSELAQDALGLVLAQTEELRATSAQLIHEMHVLLERNNALCEEHAALIRQARRLRALRHV